MSSAAASAATAAATGLQSLSQSASAASDVQAAVDAVQAVLVSSSSSVLNRVPSSFGAPVPLTQSSSFYRPDKVDSKTASVSGSIRDHHQQQHRFDWEVRRSSVFSVPLASVHASAPSLQRNLRHQHYAEPLSATPLRGVGTQTVLFTHLPQIHEFALRPGHGVRLGDMRGIEHSIVGYRAIEESAKATTEAALLSLPNMTKGTLGLALALFSARRFGSKHSEASATSAPRVSKTGKASARRGELTASTSKILPDLIDTLIALAMMWFSLLTGRVAVHESAEECTQRCLPDHLFWYGQTAEFDEKVTSELPESLKTACSEFDQTAYLSLQLGRSSTRLLDFTDRQLASVHAAASRLATNAIRKAKSDSSINGRIGDAMQDYVAALMVMLAILPFRTSFATRWLFVSLKSTAGSGSELSQICHIVHNRFMFLSKNSEGVLRDCAATIHPWSRESLSELIDLTGVGQQLLMDTTESHFQLFMNDHNLARSCPTIKERPVKASSQPTRSHFRFPLLLSWSTSTWATQFLFRDHDRPLMCADGTMQAIVAAFNERSVCVIMRPLSKHYHNAVAQAKLTSFLETAASATSEIDYGDLLGDEKEAAAAATASSSSSSSSGAPRRKREFLLRVCDIDGADATESGIGLLHISASITLAMEAWTGYVPVDRKRKPSTNRRRAKSAAEEGLPSQRKKARTNTANDTASATATVTQPQPAENTDDGDPIYSHIDGRSGLDDTKVNLFDPYPLPPPSLAEMYGAEDPTSAFDLPSFSQLSQDSQAQHQQQSRDMPAAAILAHASSSTVSSSVPNPRASDVKISQTGSVTVPLSQPRTGARNGNHHPVPPPTASRVIAATATAAAATTLTKEEKLRRDQIEQYMKLDPPVIDHGAASEYTMVLKNLVIRRGSPVVLYRLALMVMLGKHDGAMKGQHEAFASVVEGLLPYSSLFLGLSGPCVSLSTARENDIPCPLYEAFKRFDPKVDESTMSSEQKLARLPMREHDIGKITSKLAKAAKGTDSTGSNRELLTDVISSYLLRDANSVDAGTLSSADYLVRPQASSSSSSSSLKSVFLGAQDKTRLYILMQMRRPISDSLSGPSSIVAYATPGDTRFTTVAYEKLSLLDSRFAPDIMMAPGRLFLSQADADIALHPEFSVYSQLTPRFNEHAGRYPVHELLAKVDLKKDPVFNFVNLLKTTVSYESARRTMGLQTPVTVQCYPIPAKQRQSLFNGNSHRARFDWEGEGVCPKTDCRLLRDYQSAVSQIPPRRFSSFELDLFDSVMSTPAPSLIESGRFYEVILAAHIVFKDPFTAHRFCRLVYDSNRPFLLRFDVRAYSIACHHAASSALHIARRVLSRIRATSGDALDQILDSEYQSSVQFEQAAREKLGLVTRDPSNGSATPAWFALCIEKIFIESVPTLHVLESDMLLVDAKRASKAFDSAHETLAPFLASGTILKSAAAMLMLSRESLKLIEPAKTIALCSMYATITYEGYGRKFAKAASFLRFYRDHPLKAGCLSDEQWEILLKTCYTCLRGIATTSGQTAIASIQTVIASHILLSPQIATADTATAPTVWHERSPVDRRAVGIVVSWVRDTLSNPDSPYLGSDPLADRATLLSRIS